MDVETLWNALLVLLFVLVGGVFAGTEIALISLRSSQVDTMAEQGGRAARVAKVARDPNRFLSAVQIGVTVAGFFSAAFGASTLAPDFVFLFTGLGLSEGVAGTVSLVFCTLVVSYFSLVLGELVPKRIALQNSEGLSLVVTPPLDRFAKVMRPVIWLLSKSTNLVLRLLGQDPNAVEDDISEEELRRQIAQLEDLPQQEREMLDDVFEAGERIVREVMTPRPRVTTLTADLTVADVVTTMKEKPYSRYPVTGDSVDDVRGYLHARDLLGVDGEQPISELLRDLPGVPDTNKVLPTLSELRAVGAHLAVVVDEHGGFAGIVTLEDLVEELVGEIQDEYDSPAPEVVIEAGDARLVDAGLTIEEFAEHTGVELADGDYETVGGYVAQRLGRLAARGDVVPADDHELVVTAMDGRRVAQVALREAGDDDAVSQTDAASGEAAATP
ncbi:hemolysin family protein [Nocardioides sp. CFH 31398]|uniref:hemolysin family protein n=1 Tax=Nocardioides sp. CFH 31398 TaxID=2919579 RepID=UPI001F064C57|nr:hemolysin family protein [Nocardioides sp. CFH 31398]MCH1865621.1 hemolysin family protein [Nocardioides sp. CFH 31398]